MTRSFQHPLAAIAEQQATLINLDRERRRRALLALERLLDEAEYLLNDLDVVSDRLAHEAGSGQ